MVQCTSEKPAKAQALGDGVFWLSHDFRDSLFIEFDDHLMMVGCLRGVAQRIEHIKKRFPDKPIKYALITHHHGDHIGGNQDILDADITFIVAAAHEQTVLNELNERGCVKAKFSRITDKHVFEDENQRVEIYDIGPTPHAEYFLVAYVPKRKIIFETDHSGTYDPCPP